MSFRPTKLTEMMGQDHIKEALHISIGSAKSRQAALGHILFSGGPGLGKTTLATTIANELGAPIQIANGATFKTPKNIVPYLMALKPNSILFVDEIHRLSTAAEEFLYPVMEDFKLSIVAGKNAKGQDQIVDVPIPAFTLVGATTEAGSLSAPFRDRFKLHFTLELYDNETLYKLIYANSARMKLNISQEAMVVITKVSRGTPRIANAMLEWVRDYAITKNISTVQQDDVFNALAIRKIDKHGLSEDDRKYLRFIKKATAPLGLKTLSFALNINVETIENVIEPYLIRLGLISRTSRGRVAV